VRKSAVFLGHRAKRGAVPALIELPHDPEILVRFAAMRALGEIGDDSAVKAIESVACHDQPGVRQIAPIALAMLGVHQGL
jgi:HEAT repeat protein